MRWGVPPTTCLSSSHHEGFLLLARALCIWDRASKPEGAPQTTTDYRKQHISSLFCPLTSLTDMETRLEKQKRNRSTLWDEFWSMWLHGPCVLSPQHGGRVKAHACTLPKLSTPCGVWSVEPKYPSSYQYTQ